MGAAGVAAVLAAGAVTAVVIRSNGRKSIASDPPGNSAAGASASTTTTTAPPPLTVVSTSPKSGATGVDGAQAITFTTNQAVKLGSTQPTVTPSTPGQWTAQGDQLTFTPTGAFPPDATVQVTVPQGLSSTKGATLAQSATLSFHTGTGSVLGLDEALANLGYLPIHFSPSAPVANTVAARQKAVFDPPAGSFSWAWKSVPPTLAANWVQGKYTTMVKGAVMAFEADQGLAVDGIAGPKVWAALTTTTKTNTHGYTYALASKTLPETLTVWHNGTVVSKTPANTGIAAAPTADGTFPVYERLATQIMRGTNPNGTKYADPVAWVAYFNGGDAVHYINRASYGYPQSLGCVEVSYNTGKTVWPYLTLGSLVTVAN